MAELFEPKGESAIDDPRTVKTNQAFRVFDTDFASGTVLYATRIFGRLSLDQAFSGTYEPGKVAPAHLLQPLEIYANLNAVAAILHHANITGALLTNMSELVRANFWQRANFSATGGHLFTWVDQSSKTSPAQKNTFQLALFYDASSTYVVYNYISIGLVRHLDFPVMAGFARRNSHEVALLPFSGTAASRLPAASGTGDRTPGRFIYQVDSWPPVRGGCLSEDPPAEQDRRLGSTITRDSVLGGTVAIVSGRCPDVAATGVCRVSVEGRQVAQRPATRCDRCLGVFWACEMPPALRVGQATLELVPSSAQIYSREFTFVSPDDPSVVRIHFNDSMDNWMQLEPAHLTISYETASTLNGSLKLQVVGYSEAGLTELDRAEDFSRLTKVLYEAEASSTGRMDLGGRAVRCPAAAGADCETYQVGFLRIVDSATPASSIRSRLIPLGWFVHPYYLEKQSPAWPADRCRLWHEAKGADVEQVGAQLRALACPGQMKRLLANPASFLPMAYCPELTGGCGSATPKQRCFVSRPASGATIQGAPAAVCCYNDAEDLIYQEARDGGASGSASWSQFGSTSLRSHPLGLARSSQALLPGQASYLSHWYWDVLPRLLCCRWSTGGQCNLYYMQSRPSPRVSAYTAGPTAHMVGDPHVTSYGGQRFLFNGYGEFWLVQVGAISLQARYQTLTASSKDSSATFLTALVARVGTRHLEVLPQGVASGGSARFLARRWQGADAFNQALPVDLGATAASGEPFVDVGITAQLVTGAAQDRLILQLVSGADSVGVELAAPEANLTYADLFLSLSASLRERTRGLLGQWTADPAREFVDPAGNIVVFNGNSSAFHAAFCLGNQLKNLSESLFSYSGASGRQQGFNGINVDPVAGYKPAFDLPPAANPQESVVCGASDPDCVFDIRVTGSADVARATAATGKAFDGLRVAENSTGSTVCDAPAIPGIRLTQSTTLGTSLAIVCSQPLRATRAAPPIVCTRQADGNATWVPDPASLGLQCAAEVAAPGQANIGLIVGIVVPLVVLLLIAIVVIVIVVRRRSSGDDHRPDAYKPGTQVQMSQPSEGVQRSLLGGVRYSTGRQDGQRPGRPGGGGGGHDEVMAKGYPPSLDDGNRRNPRAAGAIPQQQQPAAAAGYSGVATSDVDVEAPRAYAPVPAQRGSYERSQRDPVMESEDDGAAQYQQPHGKPKPVVSHSEVV